MPDIPSSGPRRSDLLAIAFLLIVPTVLFADVIFAGRGFFQRDLTRFYEPYAAIFARVVHSGEFPFWNRWNAAGQPLAANPNFNVFYPLKWLVLLPDLRLGFQLHLVLHVHVALAAMYLLLRSMRLRIATAVFGALTFGLSGIFLSYISFPPFLFSVAWLPLVLLFVRRALIRPNLRDGVLASVFFGLQFLAGEPTTLLQTILLCFGYGVHRALDGAERFKSAARNLAMVLLLVAGGAMVGAVQLLPAIDSLRDSPRGEGLPFETVALRSMPVIRPVELFYPSFLGRRTHSGALDWGAALYKRSTGPYLMDIYFGLIAAVLAIAGFIERRRGAGLVASLALLSYLLAIGEHTPLLGWLYRAGLLATVRYPEKFILFGIVALIIFSARMFDQVSLGDRQLARVALALAGLVSFVAVTMYAFSFLSAYGELYASLWKIANVRVVDLVVAASRADWLAATARSVAVVALFGLVLFRGPHRAWYGLVAGVVLLELGLGANRALPRMPRDFFESPGTAGAVRTALGGSRLFHEAHLRELVFGDSRGWWGDDVYWLIRNGLYPRTPPMWEIAGVLESDYDRTHLPATRRFYEALMMSRSDVAGFSPVLLSMSNVGAIARHVPEEQWRRLDAAEVRKSSPVTFLRYRHRPRYDFAQRLERARSVEEFVRALKRPYRGPARTFVDFDPFQPAPGRIVSMEETANRTRLQVISEGKSFLVISETPHRYWHARIDGRPAELLPANIGYQGLILGGGRHQVDMEYRNPVVILGGILTLAALIAGLGAFLARL